MKKLYNGIIVNDDFPLGENVDDITYLNHPPKVINVSVGRQLFVDNFLIDKTDLLSEYHKPQKFEGNPIFYPQESWEKEDCPVACPKSGGVWYDEEENLFKMWYEASWLKHMAYATSKDGINWNRPKLDIVKGTNIILDYDGFELEKGFSGLDYLRPDSTTVVIDYDTKNKNEKYKLFLRNPEGVTPALIATSKDGIHFENFKTTPPLEDRSTIFYNPFRKKWVFSIRKSWTPGRRARSYYECDDYINDKLWSDGEDIKWLHTNENDLPNPYIDYYQPDLYNVDCVGYESVMLGMFQILYGPDNQKCENRGVPKITELIPIFSRDGFHFTRPSNESIINASMYKGAWDRGYIQSVGGVCIINGDELWIYYIGFAGDENKSKKIWFNNGMYSNGALGIAKIRRDGFVSLTGKGSILTKSLVFYDRCQMFVNIDGELVVEILDENDCLVAKSDKINSNNTHEKVLFKNFDISSLSGKVFKLRFVLDGKLYSFDFTDESGDSHGAHAGGIVKNETRNN